MHRIAEMVAGNRLDEVEHKMQGSPEEYPRLYPLRRGTSPPLCQRRFGQ